MSLRRILHPWFDIPEIHELREACIAQGADYIALENGATKAWDDARIVPFPGETLPRIFGPMIRPTEDAIAQQNAEMIKGILEAKGVEERFIQSVTHFKLSIGKDSFCLSYYAGRDRFRIGSETRDPEASPISWLTGGGIHLERVPAITATEEAEIGGPRAYLVEQFEERPIRRTLLDYTLDEERLFSTSTNSLDFVDFQFNLEHAP